ncbi:hypothetical protein CK203_018027 [Vitis vinifera]|uniref:SHSP domain-containing protein n=1 Tax=Vitis vinifera TaxID=29760 RepID=A0A438JW76_VITVI|nr:hypothetical protein CK203_018027 [Vitis vinifera]
MEVKNPEDLVFSSTETDTHFILTSNLEGYEVQKIGTLIKEDTIQIAAGGEKAVRRWMKVSVVVEPVTGVKKLRKHFWIPDGVVSNKIKTKFNEEESVLSILMPKSVRGVSGVGVEEVKEEEIGRWGNRRTGPVADKVPETENPRKNEQEMEQGKKDVPQHESEEVKEASGVTIKHPEEEPAHQLNKRELTSTQETPAKEDADLETKGRAAEECEQGPEAAESTKVEADQVTQRAQFEEYNAQAQLKPEQEYDQTEYLKLDHPEEVQRMGNEVQAEIDRVIPPAENVDNSKGSWAPPKKSKQCGPCMFAGSAILVSILVLAIHF